jgi:hypothetical protein
LQGKQRNCNYYPAFCRIRQLMGNVCRILDNFRQVFGRSRRKLGIIEAAIRF